MTRIKGFDPWWNARKVVVAVVIIAVVIGILIVRSRPGTSARTVASRLSRYCELSRQFDQLASGTGASTASGAFDGPPGAISALVAQTATIVAEMKADAPSAVRSDLGTVVAAVDKAARGDRAATASPSFTAARARLAAYQGKNCPTGAGSGEG